MSSGTRNISVIRFDTQVTGYEFYFIIYCNNNIFIVIYYKFPMFLFLLSSLV